MDAYKKASNNRSYFTNQLKLEKNTFDTEREFKILY